MDKIVLAVAAIGLIGLLGLGILSVALGGQGQAGQGETIATSQPVAQGSVQPGSHWRVKQLPPSWKPHFTQAGYNETDFARMLPIVQQTVDELQLPADEFMGLISEESGGNPRAVGPRTRYGRAKGIGQFIDSTARGYGIDPFNPFEALPAAGKLIDQGRTNANGGKRNPWGSIKDAYFARGGYNPGGGQYIWYGNSRFKGIKMYADEYRNNGYVEPIAP